MCQGCKNDAVSLLRPGENRDSITVSNAQCLIDYFRRNRRAFALARPCQGASKAVQSGTCLDRARTDAVRVAADSFSSTIREYSAGERSPRAIIRLRRAIVSQDANASCVIIAGIKLGFRRLRPLMGSSVLTANSRLSSAP
jgi:hypothetical protein